VLKVTHCLFLLSTNTLVMSRHSDLFPPPVYYLSHLQEKTAVWWEVSSI